MLIFDKYEYYNLPHVTTCPGLPYIFETFSPLHNKDLYHSLDSPGAYSPCMQGMNYMPRSFIKK